MTTARFTPLSCLLVLPLISGCSIFVANGDINDGSIEKTSAKDSDERMKRLRDSGSLRPGEYEAFQEKMNAGSDSAVTSKPTVEELEKRVEESRKVSQ